MILSLLLLQLGLYVGPTDLDMPEWAVAESFNASEVPFCRGYYTSIRYEANGAGYYTDYPGADINFLVRLGEITAVRPGKHVVVRLNSPLLLNCPLLFMEDVGTMGLSIAEVVGLRNYLLKGGLLWVDDFWGSDAWEQWNRTIRIVLPEGHMFDIPLDHPIFHMQYDIDGIWQQPTTSYFGFLNPDGTHVTSERGDDSIQPYMRGILDPSGRLVVLMTVNTDIAEGWEAAELAENADFFREFSHRSYALGINIMLYTLTR